VIQSTAAPQAKAHQSRSMFEDSMQIAMNEGWFDMTHSWLLLVATIDDDSTHWKNTRCSIAPPGE
jgi:hypothetical protein